jgi:DNA-directed RNA polymerase subunit M/transcription elongation factor TFIIS
MEKVITTNDEEVQATLIEQGFRLYRHASGFTAWSKTPLLKADGWTKEKRMRRALCPLCGEELSWVPTNKHYTCNEDTTHIYTCPACPFLGIEYYNNKNVEDLKTYLTTTD